MTDENKSSAAPNSPPPADPFTDPVNKSTSETSSPVPVTTSPTQSQPGNIGFTSASPSPSPGIPDTTHETSRDNDIAQEPANTNANQPPSNPQIAGLKAMFPDFDDAILQSVLESARGNQDQAIDTLLGMSDPDYRSDARPQPEEQRVLSQEELDEQFARSLYMQEQDEHQRYQQAQWEAQQRPAPARRSSQNAGGGDMMADVQDQFSRIAETGKKTFGNIMSKVRAKISEFDQQRQGQASGTHPTYGGAGGDTLPYDSVQNPNPNQQYQQYRPHQPPSQAQQPAFYDPNPQSSSPTIQTPTQGFTTPAVASETQGYNVSSSPPASSAATPRPPATGTGSGIDGGKLGLLPKRPVSLIAQSPPPGEANKTKRPDDDDDELEYVENPFEEGSGRK